MKKIRLAVLTVMLVSLNICTFAQQTVNGFVIDGTSGEPIPFASIIELGTENATLSNYNGAFQLEVNSDSLFVQSTGYYSQTVKAENGQIIPFGVHPVSINEVVITNSREREKKTEVPVAISTINTKTIEENKPTSIEQVLNQNSGVLMVDLGNEQHSMSIRQPMSYGAAYLYLEDGLPIRTSGVFNHNALLEINMANFGAIEIIRGPASSMYGSEAIGGAINFISKNASLKPTAGVNIQANDLGYKRSDFYASSTINKIGLRLSGYYANKSNGPIEHSDFEKLALTLAAKYQIKEGTNLKFTGSIIDYYADMRGSLDSTKFYDRLYESNQTFTNRDVNAIRTRLQLNHYWNPNSKTMAAAYFRNNSIKQNPSYRVKDDYKPWTGQGDPNLAHGELNENAFNSYGAIAQHTVKVLGNSGKFIGGLSLDYSPNSYVANYLEINKTDEAVYDQFDLTDSLLAKYTTNLTNSAVYSQFDYKFSKTLKISAAARYDYFVYDFENALDSNAFSGVESSVKTYGRFTPKLGLNYNPSKYYGFYANYGQGYVPPQVSQLFRGVKVPKIGPAFYNNYEVGSWVSLLKNKAKLEVSFYQMDGLDEIISVRLDDNTIESRNAGQTRHMGIEYAFNYEIIKGLLFRFNGTSATHKFIDFVEEGTSYNGNDMALAPRFYFNTQITYKPSFIKGFRISSEWQHVDKYYMENLNTKVYDGYDVMNMRLGYEFKMIEAWINVLNVTDELYAVTASASKWGESYSTGNPRHFTIGLAYKFKNN